MEGYLKKWTNYVTRWKKRYFELKNGVVQYSKSKDGKRKGTIFISTTEIKPGKDRCRFFLETGMATLHLKAPNEKEAALWYNALLAAKASFRDIATEHEFNRGRQDSIPDLMESVTYTKKLWAVHKKMEEKFLAMPPSLRSQIQDFMEYASEFKNLAMDTLNILEDERKKGAEDAGSGSEDEFEDAKSHATEFFEDIKYQELQIGYRDKLPVARSPNQKINIWKILKDTIGKDLSKMAVPVYFNEPLSFLQRFTEDLTYSSILVKAAECEDSTLRMAYVACFAISGYATTGQRLMKPFNPILGETFELERDGFRVISEQVSHHPPVSAIHCDHPEYSFHASSKVNTSFKGTYLKIKPTGRFHLNIHKYGDHYVWEKPYTNVNNLIIGKVNLDHHGKVEITNTHTGDVANLVLKKKGWFSKELHGVTGSICDASGTIHYEIEGTWSSGLRIRKTSTNEELIGYSVMKNLPEYEFSYFFSEFALQLNLPPDFFSNLAPTDSRYRPDQRYLENANIELSTREKQRLEEKQRNARKLREERGEEWKPMWFYLNEDSEWVYKGGYWQAKQYNTFEDCPDIF